MRVPSRLVPKRICCVEKDKGHPRSDARCIVAWQGHRVKLGSGSIPEGPVGDVPGAVFAQQDIDRGAGAFAKCIIVGLLGLEMGTQSTPTSDEFAASVQRDLERLPTIEEHDPSR